MIIDFERMKDEGWECNLFTDGDGNAIGVDITPEDSVTVDYNLIEGVIKHIPLPRFEKEKAIERFVEELQAMQIVQAIIRR